ncbi:FAD binding domain-containing protein [Chloroflexota bacterium]
MPKFEYFEPGTIEEACSLLLQEGTKLIAGGTDLVSAMKQKVVTPRALVNIKRIPNLDYVEYKANEGLRIGALTTLHTVATSPVIKEQYGILAQAAGGIGIRQITNMATLGGNVCLDSRCFYYNQSHLWKQSRLACYKDRGDVCHVAKGSDRCLALFVADTVPALIALDAEVTIAGLKSEKQIALETFYTGRGEKVNLLQPGEVITEIRIPRLPAHTGGAYLKYSLRDALEFAVVGIAVIVTLKPEDGVCSGARLVFGSVDSIPTRLVKAEGIIRGREVDDKLVGDIEQAALKEIRPITHMGIPASYKRRIIGTLTKRAVRQAWHQAKLA